MCRRQVKYHDCFRQRPTIFKVTQISNILMSSDLQNNITNQFHSEARATDSEIPDSREIIFDPDGMATTFRWL